jgi:hypothetical protein
MEAFSKHIMAVAKFIEFRGPSQFRTPISAGLLHEIRRLVVSTHSTSTLSTFCLSFF